MSQAPGSDAHPAPRPDDAAVSWEQLVPELSSTDWQTRKRAIQAAGKHPTPAELLPDLLEAVRNQHQVNLRNSALEILTTFGAKVVPLLVDELDEASAETQKFLIDVLGVIASPLAAPRLATLLNHADQNVRFASAEALGHIGVPLSADILLRHLSIATDGTEQFIALQALTNSLRTGIPDQLRLDSLRPLRVDPLLTRALLELLRTIDNDEAFQFLWDWLEDFDEFRLQEAARFLGRLNPERLQEMTGRLGAPRLTVSPETIRSLSASTDKDSQIGTLWFALWSDQPQFIHRAFHAQQTDEVHLLATMSCLPIEQLSPVLDELETLTAPQLRMVVELVGRTGSGTNLETLWLIADREVNLRSIVFHWSCELGSTHALRWLPELLSQADAIDDIVAGLAALLPEHRTQVLDVLSPWSEEISASAEWRTLLVLVEKLDLLSLRNRVERAWKRADPDLRASALSILAKFKLEFARRYLAMALVDNHEDVRLAAAEIVADIATMADEREVRMIINDQSPWIRALGIRTLVRLSPETAEPELLTRLRDRGEVVAIEALRQLENLQLFDHAMTVYALLDRAEDPDLIAESILYLGRSQHKPVTHDTELLNHPNWRVRYEAIRWLAPYAEFREAVSQRLSVEEDIEVRTLSVMLDS